LDASNVNYASLVDVKIHFSPFYIKIQKKEGDFELNHPPVTKVEVEGDHYQVVHVSEIVVVVSEHVFTLVYPRKCYWEISILVMYW
jgi:hypothetical protein